MAVITGDPIPSFIWDVIVDVVKLLLLANYTKTSWSIYKYIRIKIYYNISIGRMVSQLLTSEFGNQDRFVIYWQKIKFLLKDSKMKNVMSF